MNFYFFCYPHGPADKAGYEHQTVAIAEGLKELGINFNGNVNYWKLQANSNEFLINADDSFTYAESDVVIFSSEMYNYNKLDLLPKDLFKKNRKYKLIFIDTSDGLITPGFNDEIRSVDLVLKSHYCKKFKYPSNFFPWQFGLTNRIIASVKPKAFLERNNDVLVNFRVPHGLREIATNTVMSIFDAKLQKNTQTDSFEKTDFSEQEMLYWIQTGRRHYTSFYERLGSSKACLVFGGFLYKPFSNKNNFIPKVLNKIDNRFNLFKYNKIGQFDSWRFWESLISGCITIHVDLARYGVELPVMPVNGTNYIGIDFSNLKKSKKILLQFENYAQISNNAKDWALNNYSPKKIAERLLNLVY